MERVRDKIDSQIKGIVFNIMAIKHNAENMIEILKPTATALCSK